MSKVDSIDSVVYIGSKFTTKPKDNKTSVRPIGLDTETDIDGKCFMLCTSTYDTYTLQDVPACFFKHKYRGYVFVCFNLKFDMGSILQFLPEENLKELWNNEKTKYGRYNISTISNKCLTISANKMSVHFYDMHNFYGGSLEYNAQKYLNNNKIDIETKIFTSDYISKNWDRIKEYCIQDAILVEKLAINIIAKFEAFGVYPKKLYSTAYVSYQYFKAKTVYPIVKRYWYDHKKVLDYAMQSYNGGKFEVTEKGTGYMYEYDIVSAYPYEIANLIDIRYSRVVYENKYRRNAVYGFLLCKIKIPDNIPSPVAINKHGVNIYPCGSIQKVITKNEYEYFINNNVDVTILDGVWLHNDKKLYPFKKEIEKLIQYKHKFKKENKELDYHTVKIFLNSLYGKMVQLIPFNDKFKATSCWNPIYGSVITANTRIRVSDMQRLYPDIIAVHTDSLISTTKLPIQTGKELGDFAYECEGEGIIIGSGIYQIGKKNRFRGFELKTNFFELFDSNCNYIDISNTRPYTWREVMFRNMGKENINRFTNELKKVQLNFDIKRFWLDDYKTFREVLHRNVLSLPIINTNLF